MKSAIRLLLSAAIAATLLVVTIPNTASAQVIGCNSAPRANAVLIDIDKPLPKVIDLKVGQVILFVSSTSSNANVYTQVAVQSANPNTNLLIGGFIALRPCGNERVDINTGFRLAQGMQPRSVMFVNDAGAGRLEITWTNAAGGAPFKVRHVAILVKK